MKTDSYPRLDFHTLPFNIKTALRQSTKTANQNHAFRFLKDGLFTKLVELELDNRQISEVEILKIEKGEELDPPKKHEKRKSTFQVSHDFLTDRLYYF